MMGGMEPRISSYRTSKALNQATQRLARRQTGGLLVSPNDPPLLSDSVQEIARAQAGATSGRRREKHRTGANTLPITS